MIRQQRRRLMREIDKQLATLQKAIVVWQKIKKRSRKGEEKANADMAIQSLLQQAYPLFLKRKDLVINKSASHHADEPEDTPDCRQDEQPS